MLEEIRARVIALLTSALSPVPVWDHVPQDTTALPYVRVGEVEHGQQDTDTSDGATVTVPVHVFSSYKGGKEAAGLLDNIHAALHHQEHALTLTQAEAVTMFVAGSTQDPEADEDKTREAVLVVNIRVDEVTAITD